MESTWLALVNNKNCITVDFKSEDANLASGGLLQNFVFKVYYK